MVEVAIHSYTQRPQQLYRRNVIGKRLMQSCVKKPSKCFISISISIDLRCQFQSLEMILFYIMQSARI